jgi:hypothetical protein
MVTFEQVEKKLNSSSVTPEELSRIEKAISEGNLDALADMFPENSDSTQNVTQNAITEDSQHVNNEIPNQSIKENMPETEAERQRRLYEFDFDGQKIVKEDDDGYLGYGDVDGIKKKVAHQDKFIEKIISENRKYREELLAKQKEYEEQKKEVKPSYKPNEESEQESLFNDDPDFWTSSERNKFYRQMKEDNEKLKREIDEFNKKQADVNEMIRKLKEKESLEQENNVWNTIDNFAKEFPEFNPKRKYKELHGDILNWVDNLATSLGIYPSEENYQNKRDLLVSKYISGDKEVITKAQHISPPAGYREYFKMVDLENKRKKLIESNELNNNSDLKSAMLYILAKEGKIDRHVQDQKVQAINEAKNAVTNAMSGQQYARAFDDDNTNQAKTQQRSISIQDLAKLSMSEIEANPEYNRMFNEFILKGI